MSVKELIALLSSFDVLKIGAHPLRDSTPWHHHDLQVLKQFDAYDLNAKDLYKNGLNMKEQVHLFAATYQVNVVGDSETHKYLQYGSIVNEFHVCITIKEL